MFDAQGTAVSIRDRVAVAGYNELELNWTIVEIGEDKVFASRDDHPGDKYPFKSSQFLKLTAPPAADFSEW